MLARGTRCRGVKGVDESGRPLDRHRLLVELFGYLLVRPAPLTEPPSVGSHLLRIAAVSLPSGDCMLRGAFDFHVFLAVAEPGEARRSRTLARRGNVDRYLRKALIVGRLVLDLRDAPTSRGRGTAEGYDARNGNVDPVALAKLAGTDHEFAGGSRALPCHACERSIRDSDLGQVVWLPCPGMAREKLDPLEPWVGKRELAAYFACSVRWIESRVAEGMPSAIVAGQRKFKLKQAERWLEAEGHIVRNHYRPSGA
jgi:hypothetical protein